MSKEQLQGCECKWWKQLDQLKFDYKELEKRHNDSFEQFKQLKSENEELKHQIEDVDTLCNEKESLIDKYLQTLTEIKEIAQYDVYTPRTDLCLKLNWIKKKINDCEVLNDR